MFGLVSIPRHLGYLALAGLIGAESAGIPVPGETALVAAAVLAHQGSLHISVVIVVAAGAAIVGDNAGYLLGRRFGRAALTRPGPLARHRARLVDRGDRFFARHGAKAVFFARWVAGVRVTAAWMAGANRMPWRRFAVFNAAGGVAWAVSIGLAGFALGAAGAGVIALGGALGVAVIVALIVAGALIARRRRRPGPEPPAAPTPVEPAPPATPS